jgi:hypothetical protein
MEINLDGTLQCIFPLSEKQITGNLRLLVTRKTIIVIIVVVGSKNGTKK